MKAIAIFLTFCCFSLPVYCQFEIDGYHFDFEYPHPVTDTIAIYTDKAGLPVGMYNMEIEPYTWNGGSYYLDSATHQDSIALYFRKPFYAKLYDDSLHLIAEGIRSDQNYWAGEVKIYYPSGCLKEVRHYPYPYDGAFHKIGIWYYYRVNSTLETTIIYSVEDFEDDPAENHDWRAYTKTINKYNKKELPRSSKKVVIFIF